MRPSPSLSLRLRTLGQLSATAHSEAGERQLGKGKPVALLTFLSLAPGRRASRERLATLLWSDGSTDAARQNLRQTIWYVRRRLGDVLLADDDGVWLAVAPLSDAETFAESATHARYADAIADYAGDFVPDFAAPGAADFEEWAALERRRLRATYVGCVEALVREHLGSGRAGEALARARRARELAPHEPATWRILLEALVAARDPIGIAAAVAQLEAEVERGDLDPDAATRALVRAAKRLLGGVDVEPERVADGDGALAPDLVGREQQFRALVDAWESARRGRGRTILLTGAAGLGKTRLMRDFEARLAGARVRSVHVSAHQGNRTIASSLAAQLAEALATLPGAVAISTGSASVLVGLSPLIASAFPGAAADGATGEEALRRRATALGELVGLLCENQPIALLIDDAHWADGESLRLIGALRARVERTRALMVLAARIPDDVRLYVGGAEEVALGPLDVAGVAEFLGRLASLPMEPWSRGFVSRLHQATHGIPLLLIETLQRLMEAGELARTDGAWSAPRGDILATMLPIGGALHARLQSLGERDRIALVRLATLGRPVPREQLREDERVPDWDAVLAELERRSFVARTERSLSVWHDEVARGVLDLAEPAERLESHAWVSDTLARTADTATAFALASLHAVRAADHARLERVWCRAVEVLRHQGDTRPLHRIAADVLPRELSAQSARRVVQRTPWRLRFTRRARLAAAAAAAVAAVAVSVQWSRPEPASTTIVFLDPADSTRALRFEIDEVARWIEGRPLVGQRVPAAGSLASLRQVRTLFPGVGAGAWVGSGNFPDTGGDEVVEWHEQGGLQRIASDSADDGGATVSPDGRELAFFTRRFDRRYHQAELVRYERASRRLHRLTVSREDEAGPAWSPDGSRLLFFRRYVETDGDFESCVTDVDGSHERCRWRGLTRGVLPVGWLDDRSFLVQSLADSTLFRVDTERGDAVLVGRAPGSVVALPGSGMLLHRYVDPQTQEWASALAPVSAPLSLRPLLADGRGLMSPRWMVLRGVTPDPHLERIELERRELVLGLGSGAAVRVAGLNSAGQQVPIRALRFSSSDSAVVRVSANGLLEPRRAGAAWVRASAGGWRTDSARVTVTPSAVRTIVSEDWTSGLGPRWRAFGTPPPHVGRFGGRTALHPNGDGKFASGVYLTQVIPTGAGIGIEASIQLPVTRAKLQKLAFAFHTVGDSVALASWDHRTGYGAVGEAFCGTSLPSGEGIEGLRRYAVYSEFAARTLSDRPTRADLYGRSWHRLRLQVTPDGRCALFIDGELVVRSEGPSHVPAAARLLIFGSSMELPLLVGALQVWEGVRMSEER